MMRVNVITTTATRSLLFSSSGSSSFVSLATTMTKANTAKKKVEDDSLATASFLSASSLMSLRLGSRLLTFGLGQAMLRLASPRAYGTAAIQFELLLNTILFLSREGVRNALLRFKKPGQDIINLSVLPAIIGAPLALTTSYLYATLAGEEVKSQDNVYPAISIYALAALTELLSEPMHNLAVSELRAGIRAVSEGLGLIAKAVVTFLVLSYDDKKDLKGSLALPAFALGQLAYGTSVLLTYVVYYGLAAVRPRWPSSDKRGAQKPFFDPTALRLARTMTSQSLVKLFLTEGDKLLLSYFSALQDQGGYAIAVNYGSLIARIVFQPIEEASRLFFSKTLSSNPTSNQPGSPSPSPQVLAQAASALTNLVSVQVAFSLIFLVFSTLYLPLGLQILLPAQYLTTSAPKILATYCWYIPVLAVNGGLEAFLSSAATNQDLNEQSTWMTLFSAIYTGSSITMFWLSYGDRSLVYSNILNLSGRIVYCAAFASKYFARHGSRDLRWSNVAPSVPLLFACAASYGVVSQSEKKFGIRRVIASPGKKSIWLLLDRSVFMHVAIGGGMALMCVGVWWATTGRRLIQRRRSKAD